VFTNREADSDGLKLSAPQPPTWKGLDNVGSAKVEVSELSLASAAQLVGLVRSPAG